MAKLTLNQIKTLKPLARNLLKIKETGIAPINLVKYKKMGLIKVQNKRGTYMGKKVKTGIKLILTDKGRKMLTAISSL